MVNVSDKRPQTPPHHPNYGVHLPHAEIERIVHLSLPGCEVSAVAGLPSDQSYNNRIYYIDAFVSNGTELKEKISLVFKLNGRYFGAKKVQNEVACLRILEEYCPELPIPRVIAWSEDGTAVTSISHGSSPSQVDKSSGLEYRIGWILMTRLPGQSLCTLDLNEEDMKSIAAQLANFATLWRQLIPPQSHCGNLRFNHEQSSIQHDLVLGNQSRQPHQSFIIRGLLTANAQISTEISTLADYYKLRLIAELHNLETSETYQPNRTLSPLIWNFINTTLSRISFSASVDEGDSFLFTHYDLSPRNILVSGGTSPQVTGIVDFEFSGFFGPLEEFINDEVGNQNDWPETVYAEYLQALEANGIATPAKGIDEELWNVGIRMEKLIQHIAPWWLPGVHEECGLEHELSKAKWTVQNMITLLSAHLDLEK